MNNIKYTLSFLTILSATTACGGPTSNTHITPANGSGIAGTWVLMNANGNFTLVLKDDRSGSFQSMSLTWTFDQNVLTLNFGSEVILYNAMLAQDELRLSGGDLRAPITFHRQGSTSNSPEKPTQEASGPMAQIAGVWYSEESSLDPMYYQSITQYVILFANGTVGYVKNEGSATRSAVTDQLESFSTANASMGGGIYGQWSTDGSSVTINFTIKNNLVSQGPVDLTMGTMTLSGMGILDEGATLTFQRAQ